jgi:ketosteroid isomerase-like protein
VSQENVELVLGLQPAPGVDLALAFRDDLLWAALSAAVAPALAADFECEVRGFLDRDEVVAEGLDGLRAVWLDWLSPWESYRTEIEDALDLGDRVVVLVRDLARRRGDTHEVPLTSAAVWSVRDGKVTRAVFYADRPSALKAVGLEE